MNHRINLMLRSRRFARWADTLQREQGMINSCATLEDVGVATAAARAGADVVRNMYGQRLSRMDKGDGDFATAADVEAEKKILGVIRAARPDDAVLGEEGGQQGSVEAVRQWLVDPLCGTLNYAVGNMLVAVNVAIGQAGRGLVVTANAGTHELLMSMICG
jgi:fructose-1,6-bisphosphatase/inositol monophosphatase family enzyme